MQVEKSLFLLVIMNEDTHFIRNQMTFSNPRPAAVTVGPAGWDVIRARESFDDIVRLDALPLGDF